MIHFELQIVDGVVKRRSIDQVARPIPNSQINSYIAEMQRRQAAKPIGAKREFLQEGMRQMRVPGSEVTVTYELPLTT